MANRVLRDWTDSDKINSLTVHGERFFTRLIMKVDDFGRFFADPRILKANLFPLLLDTIREADITRFLTECEKAGLIAFYEVKDKRYVQILEFKQRLRSMKGKFPPPADNCLPETKQETKQETRNETENWRENFDFFKNECFKTLECLLVDKEYLSEQQKFNPGINVPLSLEKAVKTFWATEAGWAHKKRSKTKDINWKHTLTNAISLNRVFASKSDAKEINWEKLSEETDKL